MENQDIIILAKEEYQKKKSCFVEYDDDWFEICKIALNKLRTEESSE